MPATESSPSQILDLQSLLLESENQNVILKEKLRESNEALGEFRKRSEIQAAVRF